MEENEMVVTSKDIAAALGVPSRTVVYWIRRKGLAGWKPFDSDRAGYRTTVAAVRAFLREQANDGGRSEDKLDQWLASRPI